MTPSQSSVANVFGDSELKWKLRQRSAGSALYVRIADNGLTGVILGEIVVCVGGRRPHHSVGAAA